MMMCERCGERKAEVHIVRVQGGTLATMHLCSQCVGQPLEKAARSVRGVTLPLFVTSSGTEAQEGDPGESGEGLQCPVCGWSWQDVEQKDSLGCEHCLEMFGDHLMGPYIQEGVPDSSPGVFQQRRCAYLRGLLQNALAREAYEEAAMIRDQLRALEGPGDSSATSVSPSGQGAGPESREERHNV